MDVKHIEHTRLLVDEDPGKLINALRVAIDEMEESGFEVDIHYITDPTHGYSVLLEGIEWIDSSELKKRRAIARAKMVDPDNLSYEQKKQVLSQISFVKGFKDAVSKANASSNEDED